MSDFDQEWPQNLNLIADAPPTQPQGLPEAPTLQDVQGAEALLLRLAGDQAVHELYSHFEVKSADDLAETDWHEFIRLANMDSNDRARVVGSKRTGQPPITVELNRNTTITMRDKAVALAKMGFRVLPVKPGTKAPAQPPNKPRPPRGQYHQHIPSCDPADVAAMWTGRNGESLDFDLGINTEDLLVLDIDDRDNRTGSKSFMDLVLEHGLDTGTVTAQTPSGGRHYFYKLPADIDPTTVKFGSDKLGSGIDHRSYNSLVVGAGTVRPGKGEYIWVRSPAEYEIKEVPRSLVELCRREKTRQEHEPRVWPGLEIDSSDAMERFRRYAKNHAPEAIQNAGGRNATIAVLRQAGDYGLSYFVATEILREEGGWNETKAIPPWDEGELLELAETLEPSRERPIGCEHLAAQFEAVPVLSNLPPLTLAEWKARDLPPPDYICGNWLSTTNRVLLVAPTGLGKTMFGVGLTMAIASNRDFLHWKGRRPAKVLFIDGEMSNRLLRRRLLDEAQRLGVAPETFYALSHEDVPLAPLNTAQGQAFVNAVIEKLGGVDLIEFDNTMSLIAGDHREEEGWRQTLPWVLSLTRRGIGQIWVHHTGHDESRTYGTKTREWQMDTVIHLERVKRTDTDVSFALQFRKARERTPETQNEFKTARVALVSNKWTVANVTGFEDPVPATPLQIEWWEKLEAWTEDERERLGLGPEADIPINVEIARKVLFATEDSDNDGPSFDRRGASRQNIRDRMTEMTVKGLLRKIARGKWVMVKDAQ